MTNILLLSSGSRNKIVQYFKESLQKNGHVICADMSEYAPSLYGADRYYIVPSITNIDYIDTILKICKKENIKGILSLIDTELSLLSKNSDMFRKHGITIIGSDYNLCDLSMDKYKMFQFLEENNYLCAKSYIDKEIFLDDIEKKIISYPVFVKPINGSASANLSIAHDNKTIERLFIENDGLMIQEFLNGQEIGADVYIDIISKKVISIFTKKKILMKSGETDKAISFKNDKLFKLIESFVLQAGYIGQIDIDIFDINGNYYISEVNPRFGGGYPHAYESGVNHMEYIINNINGIVNTPNIGNYKDGIVMMKYNDLIIKEFEDK